MYYNINIDISDKDLNLIQKVEQFLQKKGIYFDNDGSAQGVYNINAGTASEGEQKEITALLDSNNVDYETETFKDEEVGIKMESKKGIKGLLEGQSIRDIVLSEEDCDITVREDEVNYYTHCVKDGEELTGTYPKSAHYSSEEAIAAFKEQYGI